MQNSLYSVNNNDLRQVDAGEAVALISDLLWAEATRLGIPISKIHISSNVNAPDGGVDAKISDHDVAGDLIRAGHTAYQIKSGKEFEPHQQQVIKNELFGETNQPSKENLKPRIRECMEEKGTTNDSNHGDRHANYFRRLFLSQVQAEAGF